MIKPIRCARSGGSSHEQRSSEKRSSESPGTDVIVLCFQWEAPTSTTEVSQSLLQDGLEKSGVNLIQRQSTTSTGNSVSYLTGININSLDAVSWWVFVLHNFEGINMRHRMLPITPSCLLPCIWQWLYTSMDTHINRWARRADPTQN